MGYEIKLMLGKVGASDHLSTFAKASDEPDNNYYDGIPDKKDPQVLVGYMDNHEETKVILRGKQHKARFFEVVGTVDLCKAGYGSEIHALKMAEPQRVTVHFYESANITSVDDSYDNFHQALPAQAALNALLQDEETTPYRRYRIAIALLTQFIEDFGKDASVILYGH